MIITVADIMSSEIYTIDAYDGVCKAERIMEERGVCCLSVVKNGKRIGVFTSSDLRRTHPNRIVIDAMRKQHVCVTPDTSLWKAKQILEECRMDTLLVEKEGNTMGLVSKICLYEELGKRCDLLTGLFKSDYVYQAGVELLESGEPISVIFIDINNFGLIDKKYGHIKGDCVLRKLGILLKEHSKGDSYLCRFGGDEFVVLRKHDPGRCVDFAETLIQVISSGKYPDDIQVTASAGIAVSRRSEQVEQNSLDLIEKLINRASLASTKAKELKTSLYVAEDIWEDKLVYV